MFVLHKRNILNHISLYRNNIVGAIHFTVTSVIHRMFVITVFHYLFSKDTIHV